MMRSWRDLLPKKSMPQTLSLILVDERDVTKQCLRVCEDAKSYIESLEIRESSILSDSFGSATEDDMQNMFEAQFLTRQALKKNRDSFADIIGHLQKRLESSFER